MRRGCVVADPRRPTRAGSGLASLALAGAGLLLAGGVYLYNFGDNAYLWIFLVGLSLIVVAPPFALAALLPYGPWRRLAYWLGLALLVPVGVFGTVLLGVGVFFSLATGALLPSPVAVAHIVAVALLLATLYTVGARLLRSP